MSGFSKLYALPEAVRAELHKRYLEHPHLTINDHLRWIVEQGYAVSRSSLHRYLVTHKDAMLTAKLEQDILVKSEEATRLRCLELAAQSYRGDDQAELSGLAEGLLEWIQVAGANRASVA
ncbi:hypothetical protein D3C75_1094300 [compost metagenome]